MVNEEEIKEPLLDDAAVDINYENEQKKPEQKTSNSLWERLIENIKKTKIIEAIKRILFAKEGQESEGVVEAFDQNVHSTDFKKKTNGEIDNGEDLTQKSVLAKEVLEEVSRDIVKKKDLKVEEKAEALKNLYEENHSEDTTEIGVKYIKELLNDENATPELKKSFLFPVYGFKLNEKFEEDKTSFAFKLNEELRKDEKIIKEVAEYVLQQKQDSKKAVEDIDEEISEIRKEIVTMDADSDEKKKEKEEEIKKKKQEKADMLERAQVEEVRVFLGSFGGGKGLLQEEKLDSGTKKSAEDSVKETIENASSYYVLVTARSSSMAWKDETIKEAVKKGEQNIAQNILNGEIEIESVQDFHNMAMIARREGDVTKKDEFAKKFAKCISDTYDNLDKENKEEEEKDHQKKYYQKKLVFQDIARAFKQNPSLVRNNDVRTNVLNCITNEINKSEGYSHVGYAEEIGDIFNKLFETPNADKDENLVNLAVNFFDKELFKDETSPFIKDTTLVALCSNENFTKNKYLRELAIDGLVRSIDEEDFSETVLDALKTDKARKQFAKTIKDSEKKDAILSGLENSIECLESEEDRQKIIGIFLLLSPEKALELKKLEEKRKKAEEEIKKAEEEEKKKKEDEQGLSTNKENSSLVALNGVSSVSDSDSTLQPASNSAGRNNNNDRSL